MSGGARGIVALLCLALALAAPARAEIPPELARAIETTRRAFPELVRFAPAGDRFLASTNDDAVAALLADLAAGRWDADREAAVWVVLEGLSREQGPTAAYGRALAGRVAGAAATSGHRATLEGVATVLERFLADASHGFSLLAQGLLSEKIRCGAASIGDAALVARISAEVNPDRALGLGGTDGTIADRYGLHPRADLYAVAARGESVAASGYFGTVLVSTDGGASWSAPATGTDEPLYAVAFGPGRELWAAGRAGAVLRSSDGGRTFARLETPFDRHVFGLYAPAAGTALAVGDFGLQLRTTDGGENWECIPREEDVILGRIAPAAADAVVAGEYGTLERLPGGRPPGRRGALVGVPADAYVFDVWLDEAGATGVAVGLAGAILRSDDGGATWSRVEAPFTRDLYGVGGAGTRVVIVGEGGFAARSQDGGRTFTVSELPPLPVALNDVELTPDGRAFAVGPRGRVLRSDDAGAKFRVVHGGSRR
jgi:photosystem II stability/assembly factor-like uncharacterized protein